jgi:aryl-alcohol dehydrogenase-like predicted oxidoreductase
MVATVGLPRLGLGMAALGRPGYINLERSSIFGADNRSVAHMQEAADAVIDRLFTLSDQQQLPWLDCARSYGLSEKFVSDYLRSKQVAPDQVYVSSKWGYSKCEGWDFSRLFYTGCQALLTNTNELRLFLF